MAQATATLREDHCRARHRQDAAASIAERLAQFEALQKRRESLLGIFLDGECRKVLMPEKLRKAGVPSSRA